MKVFAHLFGACGASSPNNSAAMRALFLWTLRSRAITRATEMISWDNVNGARNPSKKLFRYTTNAGQLRKPKTLFRVGAKFPVIFPVTREFGGPNRGTSSNVWPPFSVRASQPLVVLTWGPRKPTAFLFFQARRHRFARVSTLIRRKFKQRCSRLANFLLRDFMISIAHRLSKTSRTSR